MTLGLGLLILFLSICRSSLNQTLVEEKENKLRKQLIKTLVKRGNGSVEVSLYSLPEVRMLPGNFLYGIKRIRNALWLQLCKTKMEKVRLLLLLSDKKIVEAQVLFKMGRPQKALVAAREGVEKLKYTDRVWCGIDDEVTGKKQLGKQICKAGLAYKKVLLKFNGAIDIDEEKYLKIMNDLNNWNERQKEKID